MKQYADIVIFDKNGELALIVEVKNKRGTSSEWAGKMRRNMYAHGLMPNAPFFLLALPDRFYLWKHNGSISEILEPTERINPQQLLRPYYEKFGLPAESLAGKSFEYLVTSWLNEILRARTPQDLPRDTQDWVTRSGLFDKLAGGHMKSEIAA
jgi:hypothetical protein